MITIGIIGTHWGMFNLHYCQCSSYCKGWKTNSFTFIAMHVKYEDDSNNGGTNLNLKPQPLMQTLKRCTASTNLQPTIRSRQRGQQNTGPFSVVHILKSLPLCTVQRQATPGTMLHTLWHSTARVLPLKCLHNSFSSMIKISSKHAKTKDALWPQQFPAPAVPSQYLQHRKPLKSFITTQCCHIVCHTEPTLPACCRYMQHSMPN